MSNQEQIRELCKSYGMTYEEIKKIEEEFQKIKLEENSSHLSDANEKHIRFTITEKYTSDFDDEIKIHHR